MAEQIPWTFKTWIIRFKGVDLPIGDLADDIAKDESLVFPMKTISWKSGSIFQTNAGMIPIS